MLAPLLLLFAGIHYGRKVLRGATQPPPSPAATPDAAASADPEAAATAAAAERRAIEEQYGLSLVSLGAASVTTLVAPQLRVLSGLFVLWGGLPIMRRALQMIGEERRVGAEVLDTVGMLATVATRHYVSSAFMFFVYAGGRKLRQRTERGVQASMADALQRHHEFVWVEQGGVEVRVPLASLQKGDVVVVDAGSPIPVDGLVVRGLALVDQHILTGEAQPLERGANDRVFATTVVCSGRLHIRVETTGRATVAAELAGMLTRATDCTSSLEAQGQRIADGMAPPTLVISALALPLVGPLGSSALLGASFLDNMRLFIPLSMLRHLREVSEAGAMIRDGRSLHTLGQIDTVVFDKTGTLTLGQLRVCAVWPCGQRGPDEVLCLAAAAEHRQVHPIARAIVDEAIRRGLEIPAVEHSTVELGFGLTAVYQGRPLRIGSRRFMASHAVDLAHAPEEPAEAHLHRIASRVYVAHGASLLGVLELEPTVHPAAAGLLQHLRARGFALHLVSGDHEGPTRALAQALGFDHHVAGALPTDKARIVADLQARGRRVCFVGDGINDGLALAQAAVSITLASASSTAIDSAQIVLPDLSALPWLFDVAGQHRRDVERLGLALGIPSAIGVAGVLFAGFTVPAMTGLYGLSMAAGLAVTMWPRAPTWLALPPPAHPPEHAVAIEVPLAAAS